MEKGIDEPLQHVRIEAFYFGPFGKPAEEVRGEDETALRTSTAAYTQIQGDVCIYATDRFVEAECDGLSHGGIRFLDILDALVYHPSVTVRGEVLVTVRCDVAPVLPGIQQQLVLHADITLLAAGFFHQLIYSLFMVFL
jgi:hypothetical protein